MKPAHTAAEAAEVDAIDFTPTTEVPRLDQLEPPKTSKRTRTRRRSPTRGGEGHD
ncbi:MAG: hypothetical protein ABIQ18_00510 [Umezawaea sp.]